MSNTTVATNQYVHVYGGILRPLDPSFPTIEVRAEPVTIGRGDHCTLVLDNKKVSTLHAELTPTAQGVFLEDRNSRNGTYAGGQRVKGLFLLYPTQLQFGDVVYQWEPGGPRPVEQVIAERFGGIVGNTELMRDLFRKLQRVSPTDLSVLITGESGTGKELVAQAIHQASPRARYPFVVIDCASIPSTLVESFLFGHEKGAFTGAIDRRLSPFVQAEGGTVFLDEIGELPYELQPRLLRVLQERKVMSLGSSTYRPVNVRVLAATRRDLAKEINAGTFRDDLYFRFAKVRLEIPPLRSRVEDIPILVRHIATQLGFGAAVGRIAPASLARLLKHDWPNNVRQLSNLVEIALTLAEPNGPIQLDEGLSSLAKTSLVRSREKWDPYSTAIGKEYWESLAVECDGNVTKMSLLSGRSRPSVYNFLTTFGIRTGRKDEEK